MQPTSGSEPNIGFNPNITKEQETQPQPLKDREAKTANVSKEALKGTVATPPNELESKEEALSLLRQIKSLEDQNADSVDTHLKSTEETRAISEQIFDLKQKLEDNPYFKSGKLQEKG